MLMFVVPCLRHEIALKFDIATFFIFCDSYCESQCKGQKQMNTLNDKTQSKGCPTTSNDRI